MRTMRKRGWHSVAHDPTLLHIPMGWQLPNVEFPPPLAVLQCPRTASSGRKLIVVTRGGSYGFPFTARFDSMSTQPPVLSELVNAGRGEM